MKKAGLLMFIGFCFLISCEQMEDYHEELDQKEQALISIPGFELDPCLQFRCPEGYHCEMTDFMPECVDDEEDPVEILVARLKGIYYNPAQDKPVPNLPWPEPKTGEFELIYHLDDDQYIFQGEGFKLICETVDAKTFDCEGKPNRFYLETVSIDLEKTGYVGTAKKIYWEWASIYGQPFWRLMK